MPGRVVADASLLAKWVVDEDDSDTARKLIRRWLRGGVEIHGPVHTYVELAGVVRRHQRMGDFDLAGARAALAGLLSLPIVVHPDPGIYDRALILADQVGRSIPDAMYLALAEQLGCELWTADEPLVTVSAPALPWVRLLS